MEAFELRSFPDLSRAPAEPLEHALVLHVVALERENS